MSISLTISDNMCHNKNCRKTPSKPAHTRRDGTIPKVRPHPDEVFYCDSHWKYPPITLPQRVHPSPQFVPADPVPMSRPPPHVLPIRQPRSIPEEAPAQQPPTEPPRCDAPDCDNFTQRDSAYCFQHAGFVRCAAQGCPFQAQNGTNVAQPLCPDHTCQQPGCPMFKATGTYACDGHKCKINDCLNLQHRGHFCRTHVCTIVDCPRVSGPDCDLCHVHRCKKSPCKRPAKVAGGYCNARGHACGQDGCREESVTGTMGSQYPDLCMGHFLARDKQVQEAARDQGVAQGAAAAEELRAQKEALEEELKHVKALNASTYANPPGSNASGSRNQEYRRSWDSGVSGFSNNSDDRDARDGDHLRPPSRDHHHRGRDSRDYSRSNASYRYSRSDGSGEGMYMPAAGPGRRTHRRSPHEHQPRYRDDIRPDPSYPSSAHPPRPDRQQMPSGGRHPDNIYQDYRYTEHNRDAAYQMPPTATQQPHAQYNMPQTSHGATDGYHNTRQDWSQYDDERYYFGH